MNLRTFFNSGRRYRKHQPIIIAKPSENLFGRVEKLWLHPVRKRKQRMVPS